MWFAIRRLAFLVFALTMAVLTSCSRPETAPVPDPGPQRLAPVTLGFLWPGDEKRDFSEVMEEASRRSRLNAKITFRWCGQDYTSRVDTAIASGQAVDAFCVGAPEAYGLDYVEMARSGKLKDITGLLPRYAPGLNRELSRDLLPITAIDGSLYVVPSLYPRASGQGVAVRKDLMEKYRMGRIATFDDYAKYMDAIKTHEAAVVPGIFGYVGIELFARGAGYVVLDRSQNLVYRRDDPSFRVEPWEQTPGFRQEVSYLTSWYRNGYLYRHLGGKVPEVGSILSNNIYEEGPDQESIGGRVYDLYNYPLYPEIGIQRDSPIGSMYRNGGIAFPSASRNAERLLQLLDWVQSSSGSYALFMYGIEGRHYVMRDGTPKLPNNMTLSSHPYVGWLSSPFMNIELDTAFLSGAKAPEEVHAYRDFIRTKTSYAPHEGFHPDYREVRTQASRRADLFIKTFDEPLTKGSYDAASLDEDIATLSSAGADDVVREVQRQLDLWRSRK